MQDRGIDRQQAGHSFRVPSFAFGHEPSARAATTSDSRYDSWAVMTSSRWTPIVSRSLRASRLRLGHHAVLSRVQEVEVRAIRALGTGLASTEATTLARNGRAPTAPGSPARTTRLPLAGREGHRSNGKDSEAQPSASSVFHPLCLSLLQEGGQEALAETGIIERHMAPLHACRRLCHRRRWAREEG